MKITIDGLSLFAWCKKTDRNYHKTLRLLFDVLNLLPSKRSCAKRSSSQIMEDHCIRGRIKRGYSEEEARLSKEEFYELHAERHGKIKFKGKNLSYICKKYGLSYNKVYQTCVTRKRCTIEEYLRKEGIEV